MNPNVVKPNAIFDEFKEVFETINDILSFFSLTDATDLIESDIETIFFKSHYIEQFISILKIKKFVDVFETKLKEYFEIKAKHVIPTVPVMEFYSDEVLSKILTLPASQDIKTAAVKIYFNYCSYKRFEDLIKKLAEFRALLVDVSHQLKEVLSPSEIEHILLVECWVKTINIGVEGIDAVQLVIKKMLLEPESTIILIKILCMDLSYPHYRIQEIIMKTIISEHISENYLPSLKLILESENLELIVLKFPSLFDIILSVLKKLSNEIRYDPINKKMKLVILSDLGYEGFVRIFKKLLNFQALHYRLKKFIYINKMKGNHEIWKQIENDLYRSIL